MASRLLRIISAIWNGGTAAKAAAPAASPPAPTNGALTTEPPAPPENSEPVDSLLVPVSNPKTLSVPPGADTLLTQLNEMASEPAPTGNAAPAPEAMAKTPEPGSVEKPKGDLMGNLFEQLDADTDTPILHLIASLPETSVQEILDQMKTVNELITRYRSDRV